MPLYMVIPSFDGDVADGEMTRAALQIQGKHKVRYRGYWVEVGGRKVLCLVETSSGNRGAERNQGAGPGRRPGR